jgi:uncharacterized membrane protein
LSKASRKKKQARPNAPAPVVEAPKISGYWRIAQVMLLAALGVTLYLAFQSLREGGVAGCGPNSGCNKVLTSRWAYFFGIPVSLFAATLYTSMLAAIHSATHGHPPARKILSGGALLIAGAAVWFIALQVFVLHAYCWFCLSAHVAGIIGAGVLLTKLATPQPKSIIGAAAFLGLFIVGQLMIQPKTFVQTSIPQGTNSSTQQVAQVSATNVPVMAKSPAEIMIPVLNGQFNFKASDFPYSGNPEAPERVVKLFDFTCHYCRELYFQMEQAKKTFTNVTVFSLPVPLDSSCNRLMRQTQSAHIHSCEITKIALAFWNSAPEKFHEFEQKLWASTTPLLPEQVRSLAADYVGREKIEAALAEPRLAQQIEFAINVYEANSRQAKRGNLPQMIFPANSIVGAIRSPQELLTILTNNFMSGVQATNAPKP